ncbi:MAG: hypothetical protein GXO69_09330 [Acidobacteria bacterium]|nr:hypothetical protein [Acidobacteriota bacterium]
MFTRLFVIVAVAAVYFSVSIIFRKRKISTFVGMEYLILGFLLSKLPLGQALLKPLLFPFLGWIGLLIGLEADFHYLKEFPRNFLLKAGLWVTGLVSVLALALAGFTGQPAVAIFAPALAPVSFRTVSHFIPAKGAENRTVLFFVSILPFFILLLLTGVQTLILPLHSLVYLLCFSTLFAIFSRALLSLNHNPEGLLLVLIGVIILLSETCAVFGISPLAVSFFAGVYLANTCKKCDPVYHDIAADEKPLYMLFLLLVGMLAGIPNRPEFFLSALFMALIAGILRFVFIRIPWFHLKDYTWAYFMAPGGLAVAIGTDIWIQNGNSLSETWFPAFLVAVMLLQATGVLSGKSGKAGDMI